MEQEQIAKTKLKKYNQEHIIEILDKINGQKKQELIQQIINLDLEKIKKIYEENKNEVVLLKKEITPIDFIDKEKITQNEKKELEEIGSKIISSGQYAVVTMAGGQGTRLGFNGPKGTFKLDIGKNGKYIFEILADTLKRANEKFKTEVNWYIMTSIENDSKTKEFFEKQNYFGLNKEKIKFFTQGVLPLLTPDGKLVINKEYKIKGASDGNGGVYTALKQEKMLEDMKKNQIKWVYICGVDNIMVNPVDSLYLGLTIKQNKQIASKSVVKVSPDEKVGAFAKKNGKPTVVEYTELSQEMINSKNKTGELLYGESNIVSHLYTISAIEKIANKTLKYHLAKKKNEYLDKNENIVESELYKFEAFIFDGFEYFDDMLVMRVKREEEFAPIKNKQGTDSPETAKEIYENYFCK